MPAHLWRSKSWVFALVATEAIYFGLLMFEATNGLRPVASFLAALAALFLLYRVAWWCASGSDSRPALAWIWIGGILFRLTLLPAGLPFDEEWGGKLSSLGEDARGERVAYDRFLLYDSDIWRYLWDGHVGAYGLSPYQYAPADPALDLLTDESELWRDVRDNVNHPDVPTIYPPLSQALFRLSHAIAPGSVLVMKGLVTLCDLGAAVFLALTLRALGRAPVEVLLYLWNPLVVKVFSGSGHADSLLVLALAAVAFLFVVNWRWSASLGYGLAVLAKIAPIVLLPFVVRRLGWVRSAFALSVVGVGYGIVLGGVGFRVFSGLFVFGREWQFNAGPYALLSEVVSPAVARGVVGVALAGAIMHLAVHDDGRAPSFPRLAATTLGLLIVLGPTVMPWYVSWLLPLAVLAQDRVWLTFTALVCLAFLVMIDGEERGSVLALEYGALAVTATYPKWRRAIRDRRARAVLKED